MEKPENVHTHRRKKQSSHPSHTHGIFRKSESILSRQLLKALGFIFILASLWVASKSAGDLMNLLNSLGFTGKIVQPSGQTPGVASPIATVPAAGFWVLILWGIVTSLILSLSIYLSIRFRRREIPRLLVPVFYAFLVLTATRFKWPVHMLFPLIFLFSVLMFWAGRQLHATLASRLNVLFGWSFIAVWWGLKLMVGADENLILPFVIYSTLLYILFYSMGLARGFQGTHKSAGYFEILVIAANISVYFLIVAGMLYKFGGKDWIWLFSLMMGIQIFFVQAWIENKETERIGYLLPGMVFISLALPLVAQCNYLILFFGIGSVLLMAYSRFSQDKWGLVISLVAMALMLGAYFFDWIFSYLPAIFLHDFLQAPELLKKGLIASIFILPVIWVNQKMVRESDLGLSKKWFSRHRYARLYKGFFLVVVYLSGFWIVNYLLMLWLKNGEARLLSWSIYTFLYFLILIPVLAKQQSSFLRNALWISLLVALAWPLLVHFQCLELRNESLLGNDFSPLPFFAHYIGLFLLVSLLLITGYHFYQMHKENQPLIRGIQVYLMMMGLFLLLSEFDHLVVLLNYQQGLRIEDITRTNHRFPFTILVSGFAILVMVYGFLKSNRFLRVFALALIVVVLGKMVYTDFQVLSGTGKVVLLFVFGGLLLIFSFFYPRIKRYFDHSGHHHQHHHPNQQS